MDYRTGHGLQRIEDRRLAHVVPETIDAHVIEVRVQCAPPEARLLLCEIGKHTWAWPHGSGIQRAIGIFDEVISCDTTVKRRVVLPWEIGNVQVRICAPRKFARCRCFAPPGYAG